MSFGLPPSYKQDLVLTAGQEYNALVLLYSVLLQQDYSIDLITGQDIIAAHKNKEEEITVTAADGKLTILSESIWKNFSDGGSNKNNVDLLVSSYKRLLSENATVPEQQIREYNKQVYEYREKSTAEPAKSSSIWQGLIPEKNYFATPGLIAINIIIFLLMVATGVHVMNPSGEALISWGGNFKPHTLNGEWWRLLSSCFLHIGIVHLLVNMYSLLYIGIILERFLGSWRFLILYLLTGIVGSAASLWWHDYNVSAGASGAIFGMFGVFAALLFSNVLHKEIKKTFLGNTVSVIVINLVIGPFIGVDNAGHIGGLVSGIIGGIMIAQGLKTRDQNLYNNRLGFFTALCILICVLIYFVSVDTTAIYKKKMDEYGKNETIAMQFYYHPSQNLDSGLVQAKTAVEYWNKNLLIMTELENANLPKEYDPILSNMKAYTLLRQKTSALYLKSYQENTDIYESEIRRNEAEIEKIIGIINRE